MIHLPNYPVNRLKPLYKTFIVPVINLSLAALSRSSGLSDRAIRYIENNERQPGIDAIKKLSAALDVSTS